MRPVIMALFPAFAGIGEAPNSGSARKGKHTKRTEKALGGHTTEFLGPRSRPLPWICLSICIPEFSAALQRLLGRAPGLVLASALSCRAMDGEGEPLGLGLRYCHAVEPHSCSEPQLLHL